eukprot:2002551-Pyramimonas_sp.AAC.1
MLLWSSGRCMNGRGRSLGSVNLFGALLFLRVARASLPGMKRAGPSSFSEPIGEAPRQESHASQGARMTLLEEHVRH